MMFPNSLWPDLAGCCTANISSLAFTLLAKFVTVCSNSF